MYDLVIIGGGPAGIAAGVYAARKQLKTLFLAEEIGGQSTVSFDVQNWIGTVSIPGAELRKNFEKHLRAYADGYIEIRVGERVERVEKAKEQFLVLSKSGGHYETKTVLVASGAARRKLPVPGAAEFDNKGLTYCASCDGPLFAGMDTAVIGGGNAGFETAAQLLAYAKSVTLLHHREDFKADPVTVKKVLSHPNMKGLLNVEPVEVRGEKFVKALVYKEKKAGKVVELPVQGIFVEIGVIPSTSFAKDLLELDPIGRVVTNPKNQRTSIPGVWAAGDCTDELYHQNNIAAGDAVKALEDIYMALRAK